MSIFSFLRKNNTGKCSFSYPELYVPVDLPETIFNPDYGMPSGNSISLGHTHLLSEDYGYSTYSTTGTFVDTGRYVRNSTARCEYCGRKNHIENDFCLGCGAML